MKSSIEDTTTSPAKGRVWLVGAGPGDVELLTLKALRVLRLCEVWLVDDLVGRDILELARPGTRIIEVGKRGGCTSTPQEFILRLMESHARQGRTVARVKGGDPYIFGRAGEEIAWLTERGIEAQSVSGITAGLAVAGALGLPLTHRGVARGVTLVTAHTADGTQPDWQALARSGLSIVCYMGMSKPRALAQQWLEAGFAPTLPVAVVQHVSCATQRHACTTLEHLAATIEAQGLASPAIIVLGEAVRHAQAQGVAFQAAPQAMPCAGRG
ncbi:uroporphyrinogen-III C-methyltransferase [Candidimonas nitroreducens]|uniref:uroporphyrinogen-III C-methyltransferase n=1 Tax=Candidimonas nitroreducens TaxID=683354 RepID=A0A225LZM0_9BURK|nr:uroporphyrinogen-III C-methyltransferase [Candidimonas nitroreducens]OWT53403.1 uroporphyrinogen-III C-methyltransferase [Candidimonas nitroreducens]